MQVLLEKLPTILVLAVLVGIFVSLRRHSPTHRVRLWMVAWALIFLHFFVQVFETQSGFPEQVLDFLDLASLELSGILFLVSMSASVELPRRRTVLLALLAAPTAFHAAAVAFGWPFHGTMALALAVIFFGGAVFPVAVTHRLTRFHAALGAVLFGVGGWSVVSQWRGDPNIGIYAILAVGFGLAGVLYWRRYRRFSAGAITVAGGFLCWGAVFPVAGLLAHFAPAFKVNPELWNVPKFFVAFGMILSLLEDKSRMVEESGAREHAENAMLQRFSRVTSRLLTGRDPAGLCDEIAAAITETSRFGRAAIYLATERGALMLAGARGYTAAERQALQRRADPALLEALLERHVAAAKNENQNLPPGQETIVPLISARGTWLGWIALAAPADDHGARASEVAKIEMLAADLSVTLVNTRLRHQLVRSEKLAALGQLVAGVAHELNNPLTAILGYSELLAGEAHDASMVQRLNRMSSEGRRMQRIVDGLLRFARQNNPQTRATPLEPTLRDTIELREYHLHARGVTVETELESDLPPLAIGEDELKQVLLNLLNNAVDAVEDSAEKYVRVQGVCRGGRVILLVEDAGPGFCDLNRAFDPFYTTKPAGKGTGLGLSICYGIIQECGGEIRLSNRQPYGATVLVDLPVAVASDSILPA